MNNLEAYLKELHEQQRTAGARVQRPVLSFFVACISLAAVICVMYLAVGMPDFTACRKIEIPVVSHLVDYLAVGQLAMRGQTDVAEKTPANPVVKPADPVIPESSDPTNVAQETSPIVVEPAHSEAAEPSPAVAQPRPAVAQPSPATTQPRPAVAQPSPATTQPRPAVAQSRPAVVEPSPAAVKTVAGQQPVQIDDNCRKGLEFEQKGDYEKAYELFEESAEDGNLCGIYKCAELLVTGNVTVTSWFKDKSFVVAEEFLNKLIKSGNREYVGMAYNLLGLLYRFGGHGVDRDTKKALDFFEKGANCGNTAAANNLKAVKLFDTGLYYEQSKNYKRAYRFYEEAAKYGYELAVIKCALLLVDKHVTWWLDNRQNISYAKAKDLLEKLQKSKFKIVRGDVFTIVGFIYEAGGYGVPRDVKQAFKYYEYGRDNGNSYATKRIHNKNLQSVGSGVQTGVNIINGTLRLFYR